MEGHERLRKGTGGSAQRACRCKAEHLTISELQGSPAPEGILRQESFKGWERREVESEAG